MIMAGVWITDQKPDYRPLAEWILRKMQEEVREDAEAGELDQGGLSGAVSDSHCVAG
jgi:hypothetical protein